ncbi:MAG: hypothetical protein AAFQ08_03420, partial [Bacteroidota bacterium]
SQLPEGSSQLKEHEAKQSPRSPEQALQEAQQWVRDLQDASKATKWRDQSQATLSDKSKGLASGSQEGLLQAAKEAVQYAYNVVQDAEKAETQLGQLIENAAQCAIHCRKTSPAYSLGISLTHVQKKYDRLQKKTEQLKAGAPLDWDDANHLLECIYFIVKEGCIDNMVGSFHTVTTNGRTDRVAKDTLTDKLLGKASKKIAQEALQVWKQGVAQRPSKHSSNLSGLEYTDKFDLNDAADQQALASTLKHISILLIEALKAHYESRDATESIIVP